MFLKGPFNYHNFFTDNILPFFGGFLFLIFLPFIIIQIIITVIWDKISFYNPIINFICNLNFFKKYVKYPQDGMLIPITIYLGLFIPSFIIWFSYFQVTWNIILIYNIIRIGPMYKHFAYVYTLCHKEAHMYKKIFKTKSLFINNIYNYWIGLFHGVIPGSFTISHLLNHHKFEMIN